jgi:hypothetical protein
MNNCEKLKIERDILFAFLQDILSTMQNTYDLHIHTGLKIEHCEKIFDVYRRLRDGKEI